MYEDKIHCFSNSSEAQGKEFKVNLNERYVYSKNINVFEGIKHLLFSNRRLQCLYIFNSVIPQQIQNLFLRYLLIVTKLFLHFNNCIKLSLIRTALIPPEARPEMDSLSLNWLLCILSNTLSFILIYSFHAYLLLKCH